MLRVTFGSSGDGRTPLAPSASVFGRNSADDFEAILDELDFDREATVMADSGEFPRR